MKKKTPVKRKYTKKDIEDIEAIVTHPLPKAELDEIEFLDAVVTGVEQMNNEQRSRFINYIYSRYRVYITLSKLTQ